MHDAPNWAEKYLKIPLVRGVMTLAESLSLGFKALAWSADRQVPEEERLAKTAMVATMAVSLAAVHGDLHPAAGVRRPRSRQLAAARGVLAARRRGRHAPRALRRLPGAHRAAPRHQARVPVPRRRAQGDRRVRERRRGHARVGAALHDRARAVRHELPAHRDGHHDRRVLVRRPARMGRSDRVARPADPGHRRSRLRGHPLLGEAHGQALGAHR